MHHQLSWLDGSWNLDLGSRLSCRACLAYTSNHTPECVARYEEAHGHASPATPREQGELEELLDEAFPPGLYFEYEPSIASHDPLDDDLVPECPPPDVFPEDVPAEDEDPIHVVTSGVAVTGSIACDAATVLPQDRVQELFQESLNQGWSVRLPWRHIDPREEESEA
jgi:hypothetical protein